MAEPAPDSIIFPRLFTVEEANALLPALIPILQALAEQKTRYDETARRLQGISPAMSVNGHSAEYQRLSGELADLAEKLREGIAAVLHHGVELKDASIGLIDFPSRRGARVVFLCWRLGEGPIQYWHDLDAGFAGRQPLEP